MNRLKTILGYYTPAFFHINVSTNKSFKQFSDKDFSVFLHEYIHFIQDVTSIYGLNNMYVYSEYLRFAIDRVYQSINNQFDVPILPTIDNEDNIYLNKRICSLTNGDHQDIWKIRELESIEIINEPLGIANTPIDSIESVYIEAIDGVGEKQIFVFGAISIMESMAYLIEQRLCPYCATSPDFPYSIASKIVEKVYPEFGKNKLNVLALCDLSLQYSNPGKVFIQFLNEMLSKNWLPHAPEDIYDELLNREISINGQTGISLEQNYSELSEIVKKQVEGYFNDHIFQDLKDWVGQLIDTAKEVRFKNRYFILNIARGGLLKENLCFKEIRETLGTPLISNNSGEATFLYPNKPKGVEVGYFSAIGQIISLFERGDFECSLYPMCVKFKNEIDNRCMFSPWKRSEDRSLCPFAMLWRHWRLKDYTPKKS